MVEIIVKIELKNESCKLLFEVDALIVLKTRLFRIFSLLDQWNESMCLI